VDAGERLNLNDPRIMEGMITAIVRVENGKNPYSHEMTARAAAAPTSKTVEMNQTTHIHVTGAEPARQVERAQDRVNDTLVRNMRGAAQ
jgi:hypothetical protein